MSDATGTSLVVLGGGPGGYAAAFLAADLGMDVTLVDEAENPGGVCLYRGCIPSKALLHIAALINESAEAKEWGVTFNKPKISLPKVRAWKQQVVDQMTGGLGVLTKQRKITYVQGRAELTGSNAMKVTDAGGAEQTLEFDRAIIATGSSPAKIPAFDIGSDRIMDSTSALELPSIPKSLLVVGGGYIGLELGSVYAALGAKVTIVEMLPGILPGADRDLVRVLEKSIGPRFEAIHTETQVKEMKEVDGGIAVTLDGKDAPQEATFERVLVSVGRRPNSKGVGLENTSAEIDDRGFIVVDEQRRTTDPALFAIGDVAGEPGLAHKASHEGRIAVEAIAGEKVAFEPLAIPAVVFTDPEVAWTGLTEAEAKLQGRTVEVARFPWAASGRASTLGRNDGLTKLIIDPESERILGVGLVGPGAGELIAEGTLAVEMASLATDLRLTIHPHPTLSETLMEAAEVFFGTATHIHRPKRKG